MDLSNSTPIEDSRPLRQTPAHSVETGKGSPDGAARASEAPTAEGPLAASRSETGETRDAAAEQQTRDFANHPGKQVKETLREISRQLNLPMNHRVSIELDQDSQEPLLWVRHVETGEVVRRIPAEETSEMLERIHQPTGNLVDRSY